MTRYLREKKNWEQHLNNTKAFILKSLDTSDVKTVAILGSGWLLDLPLKELSKKYKKVLLVDVHHPAQIQKLVEKYKNVELFETDLSGGGIQFCWDLRKRKDEHFSKYVLDEFKPKTPSLPFKPDAFVSLNILNQLDILLVDFLKSKNGRFLDIEFDRFRKTIQESHLDWITKKHGCLISDVVEKNTNKNGKTDKNKLLHTKLPKAKKSEEWTWDFDLSKKYNSDQETRMKVQAIEW